MISKENAQCQRYDSITIVAWQYAGRSEVIKFDLCFMNFNQSLESLKFSAAVFIYSVGLFFYCCSSVYDCIKISY